ncbi:hypothetical protein F4820DRAFT_69299 [Hypoxylon rubiginosum]|uniref:Uncharacterized protein n=1 Tax=Hypoxylon rubiginosum TaxID=110542 RepID=A0ACB9YQS4_9PEZI|nr:hypothetical protein F4820DRAFT_69299 [Hypoxylon rubiginosum]
MASNQSTIAARPLSTMKRLSPFVYFYEPGQTVTQQPVPPAGRSPRLILIASWMDARDLHIDKYITQYQTIYPTSTILLVRFVFKESLFESVVNTAVEPAFAYLQSKIESGALSASPTHPEILVHTFSNGGSATTRTLYRLFRSQTGRSFPLHAAIYDSCPGSYSFSSLYSLFMLSFPRGLRLVVAPFVVAFIVSLWVWHNPLSIISGEDFLSKNSKTHNDPDFVKQTNRSYIYGNADVMVEWKHVEKHAIDAAAKGFVVRREVFEHSAHVSHMRADGGRYWKIVTETWERSTEIKGGY